MSKFKFMSPEFVDLMVLTGETIDPEGIYLCADDIPDIIMKQHQQRINCLLRGKKTEFIPFRADLQWWFAEQYHAGTLKDAIKGVDINCLGLNKRPTSDDYLYKVEFKEGSGIEFKEYWGGEPVLYVNGGYPGQKRTSEIVTPVGTLRAVEKYVSYTFGIIEYMIKSESDLDILKYILENSVVIPLPDSSQDKDRWIPCPKTPMQMFIVELSGVENTAFLMADFPEKMEELMDLLYKIEDKIYQIVAESNVLGVRICENLSADNSGGYWNRYICPQLKGWVDLLHSHGKKLDIHQDGKLMPLFGKLQEAGVDVVNGVTAATIDDLEVERLREVAGD